jgi:hypothetical protein
VRTAFQKRCDTAYLRNWEYAYAIARAVQGDAAAFERGSQTNLYVIRETESDLVKIGIAVRPEQRMAHLQIGNPRELELVDWAPATEALERFFHKELAEHRRRGEWFAPHEHVLIVCELLMSAGDLRRTMDDNEQGAATAEDTVAMLLGPAEWADEWMAKHPVQLALEVTDRRPREGEAASSTPRAEA